LEKLVKNVHLKDLYKQLTIRFSRRRVWRWVSSGMLCCVVWWKCGFTRAYCHHRHNLHPWGSQHYWNVVRFLQITRRKIAYDKWESANTHFIMNV
jgi:hypothetical protein